MLLKVGCKFERPCKLCGLTIHLVQSNNGKQLHAYDDDGRSHWQTCSKGQAFRKRRRIKQLSPPKKRKQRSLFDKPKKDDEDKE